MSKALDCPGSRDDGVTILKGKSSRELASIVILAKEDGNASALLPEDAAKQAQTWRRKEMHRRAAIKRLVHYPFTVQAGGEWGSIPLFWKLEKKQGSRSQGKQDRRGQRRIVFGRLIGYYLLLDCCERLDLLREERYNVASVEVRRRNLQDLVEASPPPSVWATTKSRRAVDSSFESFTRELLEMEDGGSFTVLTVTGVVGGGGKEWVCLPLERRPRADEWLIRHLTRAGILRVGGRV
jgi:hypothetical protein